MTAAPPPPMPVVPVTLTGRHVRLDPLTSHHLDALAEWALDPSLWLNAPRAIHSRAALEQFVAQVLAEQAAGVSLPFVTWHLGDDRMAGMSRYMNIVVADHRLEIGATYVRPAYQRTVVNTEAKYLMLTHAFEVMGAQRVELKTSARNARSRAAMERIGCAFEGIHRRASYHGDGTPRDHAWYSVIAPEWPAVKSRIEGLLA